MKVLSIHMGILSMMSRSRGLKERAVAPVLTMSILPSPELRTADLVSTWPMPQTWLPPKPAYSRTRRSPTLPGIASGAWKILRACWLVSGPRPCSARRASRRGAGTGGGGGEAPPALTRALASPTAGFQVSPVGVILLHIGLQLRKRAQPSIHPILPVLQHSGHGAQIKMNNFD